MPVSQTEVKESQPWDIYYPSHTLYHGLSLGYPVNYRALGSQRKIPLPLPTTLRRPS